MALYTERMGCIVDDLEIVSVSNFLDRINVAGMSIAMNSKDRGGLRGYRRFYLLRIYVERIRLNINKNRLYPIPQQRMRRGHKGKGCCDHFTRDT